MFINIYLNISYLFVYNCIPNGNNIFKVTNDSLIVNNTLYYAYNLFQKKVNINMLF